MRSVTREQVLAAADWAAQLAAWLIDDEPDLPMPDEPEAEIHRLACFARFKARSGWTSEASSILYAAALEGGPLPAGWTWADEGRGG